MKVRLLVSRGGLEFSQTPGQEIEVSDDEGGRMIADGQAVSLEPETKPDTTKPAKAATKSKTAETKPDTEAGASPPRDGKTA
jgi:hypothetical protein